jgi:hypothetical protein
MRVKAWPYAAEWRQAPLCYLPVDTAVSGVVALSRCQLARGTVVHLSGDARVVDDDGADVMNVERLFAALDDHLQPLPLDAWLALIRDDDASPLAPLLHYFDHGNGM